MAKEAGCNRGSVIGDQKVVSEETKATWDIVNKFIRAKYKP